MHRIDLRSDTVTTPTAEMRKAMASAEVGDDVYGEDPTVNRLQELASETMGKEAGLFVASGTMGNLVAILTHCGRGDEAIVGNLSHTFLFEVGGISGLGGVHPYVLQNLSDGTLDLRGVMQAIRREDVHYPTSRLVVIENTHNRCGGVAVKEAYIQELSNLAHSHSLSVHMDGARIFNASVGLGLEPKQIAAPVDSVTFCLSKALCAPVGSVLCGTCEFIQKARKIRKQVGGGMRQAGILAAAGLIAIRTMSNRLGEDHLHAKKLANELRDVPLIELDPETPYTNMIFGNLSNNAGLNVPELADRLHEVNIYIGVVNDQRFRLVLHHDILESDLSVVVSSIDKILRSF